ncbi:related to REX3-RNA exonuclease, member of the family of 3`-5` exonucleases [Phialocephala subalpina]|uniref:Related to REX3-RNA exonuclease, member of the family of 3`-5` exonucleases n=1 Tax=Phialocephala subalpina TaxID=576137 RepID=A0A1L7WJ09_9HELO|nr:related to REX3-RNA exonuclease, member of the family of 3`-5` exonucleases [Phialocephala subalpina]
MFTSKGLFSEIPCPHRDSCMLPRCIFKHSDTKPGVAPTELESQDSLTAGNEQNGQRKRPKLDSEAEKAENTANEGLVVAQTSAKKPSPRASPLKSSLTGITLKKSLAATREISPPPLRRKTENGSLTAAKQPSIQLPASSPKPTRKAPIKAPLKAESLNPRVLKPAPATHDMRFRLIRALHEQFVRLNSELKKDAKDDEEELVLPEQALITKALDLEEEAAGSPAIYSNLVKNKILVYKRMSVKQWVDERAKDVAAAKAKDAPPISIPSEPPKPIETGLTPEQELTLLPRLYTPVTGLTAHGYVTTIPTQAEIDSAKAGVEAAHNWEQCDRCKSRFQIFPGRREEDGALASGGTCTYHYGKPYTQEKSALESKAKRVRKYRCCNEAVGESAGCTTAENHVFKISEVKRMASVLNFEKTPENPGKEGSKPVCIDGEMGYTVYGLELIRLTATSWPDGEELFDVLVRPMGPILDLNSRYSGVWPKHMAEAPPWSDSSPQKDSTKLPIVDSPAKARSLLFSFLSPKTPLIGHGLENDLNATRLIHPTIIDTALLYPHKAGLPYRNGLKALMKDYLNRHIQVVVDGKMDGHDSKEDANAAGDLVRFKVGEEWKKMVKEGWKIENGNFKHGTGKELIPTGATKADTLKNMARGGIGGAGTKRTREEMEAEEKKNEEAKRQKYGGLDY